MRKICVVTGTRAEYGLLFWLMKEIQDDPVLELQIIATGAHLSQEFGWTYKEIEKYFIINKKVEMLLSSDSAIGVTKSMGLALISFAEVYQELQPDLLVVLGDRYEIFTAVSAALIARLPVAHIHGGEVTEGAVDEAIRHSISKMSHLHFTATEEYRKRVIQLGENPKRVFNVGGMGIENIKRLTLLSLTDFEKNTNFKLGKKNLLVTFHPVTLEPGVSKEQFYELLKALNELGETHFIFTKSNADMEGMAVNQLIDDYVRQNPESSVAFDSMGQLLYLSALQFVDGVIGNSSSGILEAPSFGIGTINIGDRQKGRRKAASVIDCRPQKDSIGHAIRKMYSKDFQTLLKTVKNPYETGEELSSRKIVSIIKKQSFENILKKQFFDIDIAF